MGSRDLGPPGEIPKSDPRPIPTGTPDDSPLRVIRTIEEQLKTLDVDQNAVAFQIPDGPQRIRGLAGTGKTVLLAQRAAKMHARHPDWRIAFVFFTRSLYDEVRLRIATAYAEMTNGETPDWEKLQVLHAWGGQEANGFYRVLTQITGHRFLTADRAATLAKSKAPGRAFEYACQELDRPDVQIPPIYDAILIDEGQDLPVTFYHLAYKALREPKRLYWAYDEAQGIGSLTIPSAKRVFTESEGYRVGDLSGRYEGGIQKTYVFRRCYRTPQMLLMAANAVNMGLFRSGGPLQGITRARDWEELGYQVTGDFRKVGSGIELRRRPEDQKHLVDTDPELRRRAGQLLRLQTFRTDDEEIDWIAAQVCRDIRDQKLQPSDLLITAIAGDQEKNYFERLQRALKREGVPVWIPGVDSGSHDFRREGHVTLANIYRAKGNEAWKVYACRFHYATRPLDWKEGEREVHKRNEAFVALTRTRLWCVATGIEAPIFEELRTALQQLQEDPPVLRFNAFTQSTLERILAEEPGEGEDG